MLSSLWVEALARLVAWEGARAHYLGFFGLVIVGAITGGSDTPKTARANQSASASPRPSAPNSYSSSSRLEWYEGGALHRVTLGRWASAPYRDRLATSADFVATSLETNGKRPRSMDDLKSQAINLELCITATAGDGEEDQLKVAEIAALCWILLDAAR